MIMLTATLLERRRWVGLFDSDRIKLRGFVVNGVQMYPSVTV